MRSNYGSQKRIATTVCTVAAKNLCGYSKSDYHPWFETLQAHIYKYIYIYKSENWMLDARLEISGPLEGRTATRHS